jgi:CRISPR-associated protein Cas1
MQLVITSTGTFLTQKEACFRLKHDEEVLDVSPLKVESIVVTNQAMITTQAVALALEHNIDLVFLDKYGDPVGRVWFSKLGSTALIRRRQLAATDTDLGFGLVLDMVGQKLQNQDWFLKKLMYARPGKEEIFKGALEKINSCLGFLSELKGNTEVNRNTIMGLEGAAARQYFASLSGIVPKKYRFEGRSFRPAKDCFNACLNYGYGMLYSLVEKSCILAGLDPYVGFLHTDNYNKKSMVFDLIEPFRILADQPVTYLFTGKKIKDEYFDKKEKGVSLNAKGKPVVVKAVNNHLDESIRYRGRNVKRRHIVRHEAHRMANILLAEEGKKRPDWLEIKEF